MYYDSYAHLAVSDCHHLAPDTPRSNNPIAFRFPNSVAAIPTLISDLQRRVTTERFKDVDVTLQIYFSQLWLKVSPVHPPGVGEQMLHNKSNLILSSPEAF